MTAKHSLSFFFILAALGTLPGQTQEKKIELLPVKYTELKAEVLKHRGKVVVVDFWAGT
ncbi:MAG: hypothetical protein HYX68_16320 [Planctomycetes bacterium]|jgi:hypothetical protein|nr:hypothetical protein [Planctomycetota bacterium]